MEKASVSLKALCIFSLCLYLFSLGCRQAQQTRSRIYRPEVEFAAELTESEVAYAYVGNSFQTDSGGMSFVPLREVEELILTSDMEFKKWEHFWGRLAGNSVKAWLKKEAGGPMDQHPPRVRLWAALEHSRLVLLAYSPLERDPYKRTKVLQGFRMGADLIKVLQKEMQQDPTWEKSDTETIHTVITAYKVVAYGNRSTQKSSVK